ncbi:hypothetical protein S7711_03292 [Stachybotrys chartarum IBT 7711]|uniref:Pyridoxamine kinase/Phosphomethylpyrimidine kinase domain-containing protein n=1 Tax=Stachybotrys chartarum (strain CBS 109288 / IBT 7711) TaxID=1280523 RepID=A0A084AUK6_STACB|nr:hypothetical protein S7711_03292 [Stachybotrys chartarum IBT 7711]
MVQGRVLVVAGSDSSGGAGLEADQKVLAAHGCYAMTATTALTAQNTLGVKNIHPIPADFVEQQIEACLEDVGVDVVKTETIKMLARVVERHNIPKLVVDPVMASTSGATLLPHEAIEELIQRLFPHTTILTPNMPEAYLILSHQDSDRPSHDAIRSVADLEATARRIQALGPRWVLLKGGHLPFTADLTVSQGPEQNRLVVDVLVGPDGQVLQVRSPWQDTTSTHGTGCSLASAIAAGIANGLEVPAAVRAACRYVEAGIRTAPKIGTGHGPLNHFHSSYTLPFSPGYFVEYLLGRSDVQAPWNRFVHHPFVSALGDGTLPLESFKNYIMQDYLFLVQFSRVNALAAYKANNIQDIHSSTAVVGKLLDEIKLHIGYCQTFDISSASLEATEEHPGKFIFAPSFLMRFLLKLVLLTCQLACTAYTRYVLDIGQSQDWIALQVALAPCMLGYAAVGETLLVSSNTKRSDNPYWSWIEMYTSDDYLEGVKVISGLLEKRIQLQSPSRIEELVKIFVNATQMEIGIWEMYPHQT